ncbi:unnamed protein product [Meloidogyne enterolobii]|uniref:Uncharacterized protein n=1 Tax=Meloidogyne enterolobii TaxID=390850 RepID=A0ACB0Z7A7_MELEN
MVNDSLDNYHTPKVVIKKDHSIYDDYEILEEIGTGAFGVVHRCLEKKTGNIFAAKFIPILGGDKQKEIVREEIGIMSELKHSSLISLHDAFEMDHEIVMIYELSYVHLDLKPENILFTTKTSDKLKINDFSMTTKLNPGKEVKIATVNSEYSSPEVLSGQKIGFNTDMWNIGILTKVLLSGISNFDGNILNEINKKSEFENISEEAKDFIRRLLVEDKQYRMNIHEALNHPWLTQRRDKNNMNENIIPSERYYKSREFVRRKYDAWPEPRLSLGRISQFSSLSKLHSDRYKIRETLFDQNDGPPRFIIRPRPTQANEGMNASFFYKILSPVPMRISWWKDEKEIKISDGSFGKYRQQRNGNDRAMTITEIKSEDQGDYLVRAENEFGKRECSAMLIVLVKDGKKILPQQIPTIRQPIIQEASTTSIVEKGPPHFSFLLRPRLIQKNHTCKLICTVTSDPPPKIKWIKDGKPVDDQRAQALFKSGVASLEVFNIKMEDAGIYTCIATNEFGSDETSASITVQTRHSTSSTQQQTNSLDGPSSFLMAGLVGERKNKLQKKGN